MKRGPVRKPDKLQFSLGPKPKVPSVGRPSLGLGIKGARRRVKGPAKTSMKGVG